MTGLVISGQLLFLVADDAGALLRACYDLDRRFLDILEGQRLVAFSGGKERRFVHQVFQIRTGKARGRFCDDREVNVKSERLVAGMDFKDFLASLDVGIIDDNLAVKASRTEKGGVKNIAAVGRGDDDNPLVIGEAVHLDQQLV